MPPSIPLLLVSLALLSGCARGTWTGASAPVRLTTAALEAAARSRPDDPRAADALAERYLDERRAEEAAAVLSAALRAHPGSVVLHNHAGITAAMRGQAAEARRHFERAVTLDPDLLSAHRNLVRLAVQAGDGPTALKHSREVARLAPGDAAAQVRLGELLLRAREAEEAVAPLTVAVRLRPWDARAQMLLGRACVLALRFDDAVPPLRRAVSQAPEAIEPRVYLGLALAERGASPAEDLEADGLLRAARASGYTGVEAPYGLGLIAARRRDWPEAVRWFRTAVQADPSRDRPRYRLARAMSMAGRDAEAAAALADYDRRFRRQVERSAAKMRRELAGER